MLPRSALRAPVGRLLAALLATGAPCAAQQSAPPTAEELSEQATDPTAPLMTFNLVNTWVADYHGVAGGGYEVKIQPVIPFQAWGASNILRVAVPYQVTGPGDDGLRNVTLFDLVVLPQSWGRLAVGADLQLSPADGDDGTIAAGPAVGAIVPLSRTLAVGAFNQNLFGSGIAISQLQPIVAWQLGHGWALSAGDLQVTYDWNAGRFVSLPIGAQLGVVTPVAGQPFRFSLNPQYNFADVTGAERFKVVLTVAVLAPLR